MEGRAVEGSYDVWSGLRQRGRREGVDSREGTAEADEQTWPHGTDRYQGPGLTWYLKA